MSHGFLKEGKLHGSSMITSSLKPTYLYILGTSGCLNHCLSLNAKICPTVRPSNVQPLTSTGPQTELHYKCLLWRTALRGELKPREIIKLARIESSSHRQVMAWNRTQNCGILEPISDSGQAAAASEKQHNYCCLFQDQHWPYKF